jgi:hypothetical protein
MPDDMQPQGQDLVRSLAQLTHELRRQHNRGTAGTAHQLALPVYQLACDVTELARQVQRHEDRLSPPSEKPAAAEPHTWAHCTPALLDAGVDCASAGRRPCADGRGSHDHLVPGHLLHAIAYRGPTPSTDNGNGTVTLTNADLNDLRRAAATSDQALQDLGSLLWTELDGMVSPDLIDGPKSVTELALAATGQLRRQREKQAAITAEHNELIYLVRGWLGLDDPPRDIDATLPDLLVRYRETTLNHANQLAHVVRDVRDALHPEQAGQTWSVDDPVVENLANLVGQYRQLAEQRDQDADDLRGRSTRAAGHLHAALDAGKVARTRNDEPVDVLALAVRELVDTLAEKPATERPGVTADLLMEIRGVFGNCDDGGCNSLLGLPGSDADMVRTFHDAYHDLRKHRNSLLGDGYRLARKHRKAKRRLAEARAEIDRLANELDHVRSTYTGPT